MREATGDEGSSFPLFDDNGCTGAVKLRIRSPTQLGRPNPLNRALTSAFRALVTPFPTSFRTIFRSTAKARTEWPSEEYGLWLCDESMDAVSERIDGG